MANTAASTNITRICHLLRLPSELRDQVYAYFVVDNDPLPVFTARRSTLRTCKQRPLGLEFLRPVSEHQAHPGSPVLAATCKQIRREVLKVFYGQNIFMFQQTSVRNDLRTWQESICNREGSQHIRRIVMSLDPANEAKISSDANGDVHVVVRGQWNKGCTREPRPEFKIVEGRGANASNGSRVLRVARDLEPEIFAELMMRRFLVGSGRCADCRRGTLVPT